MQRVVASCAATCPKLSETQKQQTQQICTDFRLHLQRQWLSRQTRQRMTLRYSENVYVWVWYITINYNILQYHICLSIPEKERVVNHVTGLRRPALGGLVGHFRLQSPASTWRRWLCHLGLGEKSWKSGKIINIWRIWKNYEDVTCNFNFVNLLTFCSSFFRRNWIHLITLCCYLLIICWLFVDYLLICVASKKHTFGKNILQLS